MSYILTLESTFGLFGYLVIWLFGYLFIVHCLLLIVHCKLPTAHCLPPTAFRLLIVNCRPMSYVLALGYLVIRLFGYWSMGEG